MASTKLGALALVVLFLCVSGQYQTASAADTCSTQLAGLVSCAASVVPGSSVGPPSKQCCSSLSSVSHECACNTLNIINSLPTRCGQTAVKCSSQYQTSSAAATCSTQLASLVSCAASVVPGSSVGSPSKQCCSALSSVSHECACNTLNIINSLPTRCGQTAVKCSA